MDQHTSYVSTSYVCIISCIYLSSQFFFSGAVDHVSRGAQVPLDVWGDIGSSCRLTRKSIENYQPIVLKTHHWRYAPQTFILREIYHAKCSTS